MKKDIIYIDVEDDITAIIGKVKDSKEKIVALVPPKRVGVLQSAVNLRLLQRTAEQTGRRIVLITGNQALVGLAAAASIPVARNLQSKPELAEIPALDIDDGEDVIDGAQLPIGDHAKQVAQDDDADSDLIKGIDIEESTDAPVSKRTVVRSPKKTPVGKKVPNFNRFRKRLIIIIAAVLVLVGGAVWAFVIAPAATVIVTARTAEVSINDIATFGDDNSAEQGTIKVTNQTLEKKVSVDFEATGEKDVGEKATGTVQFTSDSFSALTQGITIPAGTTITSTSGAAFTTDSSVTLSLSGNSGSTPVTASERGESYNGATGAASGAPASVSASFVDATSGGTSKTVPIVTAADVQAAKEKLVAQSTDDIKKELSGKFAGETKIIEASFKEEYGDVSAKPAVGGEAEDKKAVLTGEVTYTISGVEQANLQAYLEQTLKKQMPDQTTQKIYDVGLDSVRLNDFSQSGNTQSIRIVASGQIGPVIDEAQIKDRVAGKRFGDVEHELKQINGVSDVAIEFSFFWVRTVPNNLDKINIEFTVNNGSE